MSNLDDYIRKQENARLTEERDHWKQARESGEPPKGSRLWRCELELGKARDEVARLREALTRFDQLVEAAQTSHADDGYTDADVQVGKFQDELPALLALAATDRLKEKPETSNSQNGFLALALGYNELARHATREGDKVYWRLLRAEAVKKLDHDPFAATDQPKEKP